MIRKVIILSLVSMVGFVFPVDIVNSEENNIDTENVVQLTEGEIALLEEA